jgi:predicted SAM-dependent methyltransferase
VQKQLQAPEDPTMTVKALVKRVLPPTTRQRLRSIESRAVLTGTTAWNELFHRRRIRQVTGEHLLVNVACGALPQAGWVNLDRSISGDVYYANLERGIPLPAEAVRHIHCEHFLEHLNYEAAKRFLADCLRVLETGGSVRFILPDAGKYMRAYASDDSEFFKALVNLGGRSEAFRTRMEIINQMFRMGGDHRFAWDFETLSLALKDVGFADIRQSSIHDIAPQLDIDGTDWWRPFESLYVNASKDAERSKL